MICTTFLMICQSVFSENLFIKLVQRPTQHDEQNLLKYTEWYIFVQI